MASLRGLVFLSCIWCVSSQTTMMTEPSNSTLPPITEIVTEALNTTEAPATTAIIGASTLMTSLQQTTAGATTSAATVATTSAATVAMETSALKSTQRGTSNVVGTTFLSTRKTSPSALSSSVIALIAVIAFIIFILVLAAIVYFCRKRALAQTIKRRFTHRDTKMSIHRPESGMILDEDRTLTSTFNTDHSKLDKICHENPVFLAEKDGNSAEMQANGASNKATLPSTASLKVANETGGDSKVPSNETTGQNGTVKTGTVAGAIQDTGEDTGQNAATETDTDTGVTQNTDDIPAENSTNETAADEVSTKPEVNTDDNTVKTTENDDVTADDNTKNDDATNDDAQTGDDENNTDNNTDNVASIEPSSSNLETDDRQEISTSDQNSTENNNEQTKSESPQAETPVNASDNDDFVAEVLEI